MGGDQESDATAFSTAAAAFLSTSSDVANGDSEIGLGAVGGPLNRGHRRVIEEEEHHVLVVLEERPVRCPLADEPRASDEQVERALREDRLQTVDAGEQFEGDVPPGAVARDGCGDETLIAGECLGGCGLADRRRAGGTLRLQLVDRGDQPLVPDPVPQAPSGHRVGLRHSVRHQDPITKVRRDRQQIRIGVCRCIRSRRRSRHTARSRVGSGRGPRQWPPVPARCTPRRSGWTAR